MNSGEAAEQGATAAFAGTRLIVTGHVQAVGFRPFVYRLARGLRLSGWVRNRTGAVEICVAGHRDDLARFERDLVEAAPPLAEPVIDTRESIPGEEEREQYRQFTIRDSEPTDKPLIFVPPDYFMCADCRRELLSPGDRRYRYPFINCTNCGPRYTL